MRRLVIVITFVLGAFACAAALAFLTATCARAAAQAVNFPADRIDPCRNVAADRAALTRDPIDAGWVAVYAGDFEKCAASLRDARKQCSLLLESGDQYRVAAALVKEEDPGDLVHYRVWTAGAFESYNFAEAVCAGSNKERASDGFRRALRILMQP
jgi:hypothetical protein